jgi:hypothetical protein
MSLFEMSWPAQTIRSLAVYIWFLSRQLDLATAGAFDGPEGLRLLGWELLLFIMVSIATGFVVVAIFSILASITGQDSIEMFGNDERSKYVESRGNALAFAITALGFLAMVLALWQGWGILWAINLMVAGMVAADAAASSFMFVRYWRGG